MTLVDAHLHFWDPAVFDYPWLEGNLNRSFLISDLELGTSDVTSAVFVQADCTPGQALDEARWAAAIGPFIAGIVAFAPLDDISAVAPSLDALAEIPRVVGIRRNLQAEAAGFLGSSELAAGLAAVSERVLVFDACVTWRQLQELKHLVATLPDLMVVIDHLGKPPIAGGWGSSWSREWKRGIRELAMMENVAVKISGLAPEAPAETNLAAVARPYIDTALEAFGTSRCMVGSDWPVSTVVPVSRAYDSWFAIALAGLSDNERDQVSSSTAERLYRFRESG